jgi:CO/xanthine dehydrogenase Mo-binding subunit
MSPSSATNSAYYFTHSTREAARVLFVHGLWPAAISIWSSGAGGGQAASLVVRIEDARWVNGKLSADGLEALPFEQIAKKAHELGLVTGATVHVFNRWQWAEAEFEVGGKIERLPIDGLSLRYGNGAMPNGPKSATTLNSYRVLDRKRVFIPPVQRNNAMVTYYSAVGTLVELAVNESSGEVELLTHHSILECGNQLSPQLVSGQLQGGLAMGIGHALHEYLPLYEDGPGNGTWNFNRYRLPRSTDVAVWRQTSEVLPPLTETDPPKGIAEVVMIPVVGAIVNGIAHAVGHRFRDLPVTPQKIQEVLA